MRYLNILLECAAEPWALQPEKLEVLAQCLAAGGDLSADESQARITQKQEREAARSDGQIAVLPVYGLLTQHSNMLLELLGIGMSMEKIAVNFRAALSSPQVKAIVFDHATPGGTVHGTQELAEEIRDSRGIKPIIAQVNSLSASAGYWLASATDEIIVTPGGEAGSIGVYRIHDDVTKALEIEGIKKTIIKAGDNKIDDSPFEPLTEDAKAAMQRRVDQAYARMVKGISRGRRTTISVINDRFGQGRMFGAEELLDRGMADRIATLPETLERFGASVHPVASAARANSSARAQAADLLKTKLKARDELSPREWENGLMGCAGLTQEEAKRAVALYLKGPAQRDAEQQKTESRVSAADVAEFRQELADLRQLLRA